MNKHSLELSKDLSREQSEVKSLDHAREIANRLRRRMKYDVMGRDDVIEYVLIALFGDGHILLEDYPGSGKTTLAKALGFSIIDDLPDDEIPEFRRIQFTPDLLPSDVTGVMIFDVESNTFHFRRGPVFAYVVLVDEINRTTPKVQSALLEAMAEKQVTVDNLTYPLNDLFFVMATQNPMDSIGTYPLPVAQLDRFLFKIQMKHIERDAELRVLESWGKPREQCPYPKVKRGEIVSARALIRHKVYVAPEIHECLVDIARNIREDKRCTLGVSTRALVQAIPALQMRAVFEGRHYVSTEDIEALAIALFQHRISLIPGVNHPEEVIREAMKKPIQRFTRSLLSRGA